MTMKKLHLATVLLSIATLPALAASQASAPAPASLPAAAEVAQLEASAPTGASPQIIEARKRNDRVEIDEDTGLETDLESLIDAAN
jgi:hypothetical protein